MKVKVKATGEIVDVKPCKPVRINGFLYPSYEDEYGRKYPYKALKENTQSQDSPDYWTRLEHTYAGMAMQGILSSDKQLLNILFKDCEGKRMIDVIVDNSNALATALVEKLKESKV